MGNFPAFILFCLARISPIQLVLFYNNKEAELFPFWQKRNINYNSAFERQKSIYMQSTEARS